MYAFCTTLLVLTQTGRSARYLSATWLPRSNAYYKSLKCRRASLDACVAYLGKGFCTGPRLPVNQSCLPKACQMAWNDNLKLGDKRKPVLATWPPAKREQALSLMPRPKSFRQLLSH